jgi:hypothetical protein
VPTIDSENDENEEIRAENERFGSGHATTGQCRRGMSTMIILARYTKFNETGTLLLLLSR